MTSYLRMQAAAAEPDRSEGQLPGHADGERQPDEQRNWRNNGQAHWHDSGKTNGQTNGQANGQADGQAGRHKSQMECGARPTACSDVDVRSLQISGYSCTMRKNKDLPADKLMYQAVSSATGEACSL